MLALNQDFQLVIPYSLVALLEQFGMTLNPEFFSFGGLFATIQVPDNYYPFLIKGIWLALFIVIFLPNTSQLFNRYQDQLGQPTNPFNNRILLHWKPTLLWGLFIGTIFIISILMLSEATEFIYFKF